MTAYPLHLLLSDEARAAVAIRRVRVGERWSLAGSHYPPPNGNIYSFASAGPDRADRATFARLLGLACASDVFCQPHYELESVARFNPGWWLSNPRPYINACLWAEFRTGSAGLSDADVDDFTKAYNDELAAASGRAVARLRQIPLFDTV